MVVPATPHSKISSAAAATMRSRVRCPLAVSRQLSVGDAFPVQILGRLETLSGEVARVPDPGFLVHVQMRRFAGCPVCNLHLRSVITRIGEVTGAGVREVVVFHSTIQELRQYESDLPFTVLADPRKDLYRALGVESSLLTVLSPRFWPRVPAVMAQLARTVRRSGRGARWRPQAASLACRRTSSSTHAVRLWRSSTASTQATSGRSASCSHTPLYPLTYQRGHCKQTASKTLVANGIGLPAAEHSENVRMRIESVDGGNAICLIDSRRGVLCVQFTF
jgi:hypothetical protein